MREQTSTHQAAIDTLLQEVGSSTELFEGDLVGQMIETCLRLLPEKHTTAQLKLINRALKEMRYAYHIFNQHANGLKLISMFGSARTPEDHPDYQVARDFSAAMTKNGWKCITGGANGIMKAGLEGGEPGGGFGLAIKLAFENTPSLLEGDPKLINFRYFFTRKLMFVSHSHAVAAFPGGVGTMDELFEVLTLMQTGKSNLLPVVLMEGEGGEYWKNWEGYMKNNLLKNGWISPEDVHLYYRAPSIQAAVDHIEMFYRRYHSSRFVKDYYVVRLKEPLSEKKMDQLNQDFPKLITDGKIVQGEALPEEDDALDLPRLIFKFNRRDYGLLRRLIDAINEN